LVQSLRILRTLDFMPEKYKNIYVAASSQHVGKTTTTLGLVASFLSKGVNVGYSKPVGQKFVTLQDLIVDKDTILFSDLIKFDINPEIHSPIILGKGATEEILDHPKNFNGKPLIKGAMDKLSSLHDLVIFEGTGHPGVGSIADLSNARVAKILNAGVIMVIEGGIGSTIDMLNMTTSLFREEQVPIIGVIINKVRIEKLEKIKKYVGLWLKRNNIPLLGLIPYDKTLAYPLVRTVCAAIKGQVLANPENLYNKVEDILAGSIVDLKELKSSQDLLLLSSARMADRAIQKVISFSSIIDIPHSPLSGIVITGSGNLSKSSMDYIHRFKIPLIRTILDTYGVTVKISRLEVKINRRTPWKIARAIELVGENVNLEKLLPKIIV